MTALLEVNDLRVSYTTQNDRPSSVLTGVSFRLEQGEILGVLGESGSGKSTLAAALLRILPPPARLQSGTVVFEGADLLQLDSREMEKIRGGRISIIFQEPSLALHPTLRVGAQIAAVLMAHHKLNRRDRDSRVHQTLSAVFATGVDEIAKKYPHQLSGGQRARVLIALALCCKPSLVIADEPTASLDAETQQEIISLFKKLRQELNVSMVWITHSPATLLGFADRVMVLYTGQVVEVGPAEKVLSDPQHPYTRSLVRCLPPGWSESFATHKELLPTIPGELPLAQGDDLHSCCFEPRCLERMAVCRERSPQMVRLENRHQVSCFLFEDGMER